MNNVSESIQWAQWTWNPVTGCKRNCSYCYAHKIHKRFYKTPFSDIVLHPERLYDKMPKEPSKIFVGSMSDCAYWTVDMWDKIIPICRNNPQHTFMFLSKCPTAYDGIIFPKNCMQGLTLTLEGKSKYSEYLKFTLYNRPFLSIEPLLGCLDFEPKTIEIVIVGAMTGNGAIKPKKEWIESIKDNVYDKLIYWKKNIKEYL